MGVHMRLILLFCLTVLTFAVCVQADPVAERVEAAFAQWLRNDGDRTQGVLVLTFEGKEVLSHEHHIRAAVYGSILAG